MNKNEIIINELINSKLNNWNEISSQDLSEEFMDKYQDILDWKYISVYQNLSESFSEKYQDKLNWKIICKFQELPESFVNKYKNELNLFTK
ncbi:hypothetical protein G8S49_06410 [Clostridium botulinum C]|uniref:Tryptophan repeat gene family protein n=2 Tax=Clostridium botulinum TaxID=1491 RepID=A0A9Q4XUM7_CLOBO|nr:hypothetical protein [Clostridium botulinum]YP_398436.1 hypothetical protein CST006 [Clostridium phage c-st]MCD3196071.1 hypothetical protein [Clostridium botulinum C]MCD3200325.1 hypothetical protein [Clostridium botulinum C]MCD3206927.1 hypothetical protein [Clostridium botulinum C]MCD3207557.1 hypothetical protein [Clostridium botulinum C]MCD3226291.1 hypothetical protein [Clostridium botulinum C]